VAALAMGGVLWLTARLVLPFAANAHGLAQAAVLGVLIAGGIAIYALLLILLGVTKWADAVKALRRSGPRDLRP
jgi:putative peptidoglycan lipid II flippase